MKPSMWPYFMIYSAIPMFFYYVGTKKAIEPIKINSIALYNLIISYFL